MKAFTVYQPYAHAIVAGSSIMKPDPGGRIFGAASPSTPGGWTKCKRQSI